MVELLLGRLQAWGQDYERRTIHGLRETQIASHLDSLEGDLAVGDQTVAGRNALSATIPADLTGSPAISVPFGWSQEGLPIGVQLMGRHFDEATVCARPRPLKL